MSACDFCHRWRSGDKVEVQGDVGGIHHALDKGTYVTLEEKGTVFQGRHWWRVFVLEGSFEGRYRNVCCSDMESIKLSKDEEAEVLQRIQTSVQRSRT